MSGPGELGTVEGTTIIVSRNEPSAHCGRMGDMKIRRILTVDERARLTLGTNIVTPGEQFRAERMDDGRIVLFPIEVAVHDVHPA